MRHSAGICAHSKTERIVWKIVSSVGASRRVRFFSLSDSPPEESEPRPSLSGVTL